MDAVRFLLVVLCAGVAGGSGVFDSGIVGDGRAEGAGAGLRDSRVDRAGAGAAAVVRAAQKEVGVQECGTNTGPRVDEYNAYVGLKKVAWCAAFVSWCHGQAGYAEPRTAWSPALFPAERQVKIPHAGSVFGVYYPHLKRIGHCGIVERLQGDLIFSIEGNTNVDGSREGIGVFRRIRHRKTIAKFADFTAVPNRSWQ